MAAVFTQLLSSRRSKSQTEQRALLKSDSTGNIMKSETENGDTKETVAQADESEGEDEDKQTSSSEEEYESGGDEDLDEGADYDDDDDVQEPEQGDADGNTDKSEYSEDVIETLRGGVKRRQPTRNTDRNGKRQRTHAKMSDDNGDDDDDDDGVNSSGHIDGGNMRVNRDSSVSDDDTSSEAEEWEEASEGRDVLENEATEDVPRCMFCDETEENDPGEEFEEILSCSVCGNTAHPQCARDEDAFSNDDDASRWRCLKCSQSEEDEDSSASDASPARQRRTSEAKFARDLLPSQKGAIKEGSHSIFNKLILDDDPMDGSRSLRKRKPSGASEDALVIEPRKRLRRSSGRSTGEVVVSPDTAIDDLNQEYDDNLSARPLRPRNNRAEDALENPLARVVLDGEDEARKKRKRERERDRQRRIREGKHQPGSGPAPGMNTPLPTEPAHYPSIQVSSITAPFLALQDKEGEGEKSKPYGGILTEEEANTERTFPEIGDRKKFEDARQRAEELWRRKVEAAIVQEQAKSAQKFSGPPSRIKCISFGNYEIDTWHAAPYPEEYNRNRVLYICEYCLKYLNSDFVAWRHKLKCPARHPPGDEIYSDGTFSFFEVDGRKNPVYCQNLCLLAKLFLGSKTLYYDVEPFLFYIMTENDEKGCHFVGYFSKEKRPSSQNNVSCILVLPIHQRRGFGHFLIDFSYLLTRVEKKTGSPEKPLSDMGLVSYRSYWRLVLCYHLLDQKAQLSIMDISDRTGMTADDIVSALEGLRALVRDPVTKTYALRLDLPYFKQYIANYEKKRYPKINPDALVWVPYVMGRDNMHYESGAPLHTVAQREDLEEAIADTEANVVDLAQNGVSEKDYAGKMNGDTDGDPSATGTDADTGKEDDDPPTPFPNLVAGDDTATESAAHTNTPSTPKANGFEPNGESVHASPIPPIRFEVFPPIPGSGTRRRPGRPFGSRSHKRSTPRSAWTSFSNNVGDQVSANAHSPTATNALSPGRPSARRTRSSLGLVGPAGEISDAKGDDFATGSPLKRVNGGEHDGNAVDEQDEEDIVV